MGMHVVDAIVKNQSFEDMEPVTAGITFEGQGPRILVVDDSPTIRAVLRYTLKGVGLSNFAEAKDGRSAWTMLVESLSSDTPISLVLCDQNMPEMTGKELLTKVRAHGKLSDLPFILVTSQNDKNSVTEAIYQGVTDYITKPISAKSMVQKIVRILQNRVKLEVDARLNKIING
jgi:two-component system, chemotaxis family, chemotaxis protein CheY